MMTLRNFFVGRAVVFIILLIIGFAFFAYKKYAPTTTMPTETPTETSTENTGPVAFTWKYEEATSLNPDGNPNTNVFLEAKYSNGKTMSRLITVSPGSCNDLPDVPSDSVINSTAIQCYHAGLGYRFKITKSTTSYLIMRQVFEEGSPEYNPPVTNYEVDSQFPLTFSSDYKVITRATYSFQMLMMAEQGARKRLKFWPDGKYRCVTFSDAVTIVRRDLWRHWIFENPTYKPLVQKLSPNQRRQLIRAITLAL